MILPEPVIIENVLPNRYADEIEAQVSTSRFPWYYAQDVGFFSDISRYFNTTSEPYVNREASALFYPFTFFMEEQTGVQIHNLIRLSLSSFTPQQSIKPSCDYRFEHLTAVYFLNDSDENTIIYDQKRDAEPFDDFGQGFLKPHPTEFTELQSIPTQRNTLVLFDGLHYYCTQPPTKNRKMVLTLNFV